MSPLRKNVIGERYGSLTVIEDGPDQGRRERRVYAICDCGNKVLVRLGGLRSGDSKSCRQGSCARRIKTAWIEEDRGFSSPCWISQYAINESGYANIGVSQTQMRHHRYEYEKVKGKIPDLMTLDHLCKVTNCVNPDHLVPMTHEENARRGGSEFDYSNVPLGPKLEPKYLKGGLWNKVDKGYKSLCHEYVGRRSDGYGKVSIKDDSGKPRGVKFHRYRYLREGNDIPHGMVLDHLCDNKICCNPDHLEPKSNGENLRRSISLRGSKLPWNEVMGLRILTLQCGWTSTYTAEVFGVSAGTVFRINHNLGIYEGLDDQVRSLTTN